MKTSYAATIALSLVTLALAGSAAFAFVYPAFFQ